MEPECENGRSIPFLIGPCSMPPCQPAKSLDTLPAATVTSRHEARFAQPDPYPSLRRMGLV